MEEDVLIRYGTPLEPLDEIPAKKPFNVDDQIVTDENGRRRFHGAFTGGFSAGFWNTVGSLEGWMPQSFKSSRGEKAEKLQQRPSDFMDSEDLGEFGIAPQRVQAREEFATESEGNQQSMKRKFHSNRFDSSALGTPVLQKLIEPAKENAAIRILKQMGWKPGQGIGVRQTRREKKLVAKRNDRELYVLKKYGCDLESESNHPSFNSRLPRSDEENCSESNESDDEITFAPDDIETLTCAIKDNKFGLGYEGLSREPILYSAKKEVPAEHFNLFGPLEVLGKNNKKLSISGQAFGVGALEEDDDDIYARDDLTRYDFSLGGNRDSKKSKKEKHVQDKMVIDGFVEANNSSILQKRVYTIVLPDNFVPRNWAVRKSRFEPLQAEKLAEIEHNGKQRCTQQGRHGLNPVERGKMLEESTIDQHSNLASSITPKKTSSIDQENKSRDWLKLISSRVDNFTRGEILDAGKEKNSEIKTSSKNENENIIKEAMKKTKQLGSTCGVSTFKPFLNNAEKQLRYEKFIADDPRTNDDILACLPAIQPIHFSEWDREMEKKEFIQARSIYKPLEGLMSQRFVSEATIQVEEEKVKLPKDINPIVIIERTKSLWKPSAQLCKRYNIAEPFAGSVIEVKATKKSQFSVFDYLENSINTKADFVTPVIIPKQVENLKPVGKDNNASILKITPSLAQKSADSSATSSTLIIASQENEKVVLAKPYLRFKPGVKTELERRVEESKNKPAYEKKDLFKSIFEDSDEEEEIPSKKTEDVSTTNALVHSSTASNLLRNNSPPRGIFAALFTPKLNEAVVSKKVLVASANTTNPTISESLKAESSGITKITFKPKDKVKEKSENGMETLAEDVYGPKAPETSMLKLALPIVETSVNKKVAENKKDKNIEELWVESTNSKCSHRHEKKSKKKKKFKTKEKEIKKKHKKSNKSKKDKK